MANETYIWRGAVEPRHDESSGTLNQTYQWRGAVEPLGVAVSGGTLHQATNYQGMNRMNGAMRS